MEPATRATIDHWLDIVLESHFPALDAAAADTGSASPKLKRKHHMMEDDGVETPRRAPNLPLSHELTPTPHNLPPTPSISARRTMSSRQSNDDNRSSTASSATGSRSSSPTKRKRDLEFVVPHIMFKGGRSLMQNLEGLKKQASLLQELIDVVRESQRALPNDLQLLLETESQDTVAPRRWYFSSDSALEPFQGLGSKIRRIVETTEMLIQEDCHEDEWSDSIVRFVLDISRNRARQTQSVKVVSVKTAVIKPVTLLPTNQQGTSAQTKRIDYVLALDLPDLQQVRNTVAAIPHRTLNQSDYYPLCYRVLFSHLEIKRLRGGRDGEIQLGTWCAAGFKKLNEMRRQKFPEDRPPPPAAVPVWYVQAEKWALSIAIQESEDEISIFGPISEWSTRESGEVALLIITLSNLMEWGWNHYRPWFMEHIAYGQTQT